jgi:hypothetical protein
MAEIAGNGAVARDESIRANRAILTGNATVRQSRVRPATHGGTLRCLIEDVQSQRKALQRKIARSQEEILECQEELLRQKNREQTLIELLENWQRNVETLTGSGD